MDYDYSELNSFLSQDEEEKKQPTFSFAPDQESFDQYIKGPETTTDIYNDPEAVADFELVSEALNRNENVFSALMDTGWGSTEDLGEFMRDQTIKIGTMWSRANILKDESEEVKAAARRLQTRWENAEVDDWAGFIADYTGDVLTDPLNIASLVGAVFSGGASGAAGATATAAARQGLMTAIKKGAGAINTVPGAMAAGAAWTGLDSLASQNLEVAIDAKAETDYGEAAIAAATGAGLGGVIGGAGAIYRGLKKSKIDQKNLAATETVNGTTKIASDSPETLAKAREIIEETREAPQQGAFDFGDVPVQGEFDLGIPPNAAKLADSFSAKTAGKDVSTLDPEDLMDPAELDAFVKYLGGGQKTRDKLIDDAIAAANDANKDNAYNKFAFNLYSIASNFSSRMAGGKAPGVLTPYARISGTAKVLQGKLNRDFAKQWRGEQATIGEDLFEAQKRITGHYWRRYLSVVRPYRLGTLNGALKDEENNLLSLAIRGRPANDKRINGAAAEIKKMYADVGNVLKREGIITHKIDNYVPRMWDRAAIESNPEKLAQLLFEDGEEKTLEKATEIVKGMLKKETQIDAGTTGHFFSAKRSFNKIKDDSRYEEFLNRDVSASLYSYMTQAGRALAKKRVLGVTNIDGFRTKWIAPIEKEMQKASGRGLTVNQKNNLEAVYDYATGENLNKTIEHPAYRIGTDISSGINQVAYLSLATLTSLPEVLLNVGRAGVLNSVKGLNEALEVSFNTITKDSHKMLQSRHGMTAQEAWDEMQSFGLAMEQSLEQLGNRLVGSDEIRSKWIQEKSKTFFKWNGLDAWTKFAQLVAYNSGRNLIQDNIETLAKHGNGKITSRIQAKRDELSELGFNIDTAIQWFNNGRKINDPFYQEIKNGAARYTNDVILNPTAMAGSKPRWYSHPNSSFMFQILSYPAAFSNTVLKGAAKTLIRNPTKENVAKITGAALTMVGAQAGINYIKTRGESVEDKEAHEIAADAVQRAGGLAFIADAAERAGTSAMYTRSLTPYAMMFFGPAGSDATKLFNMQLGSLVTSKVPLGSAINTVEKYTGTQMMDTIRDWGRDVDRDLRDFGIAPMPVDVRRKMFAKGGEVEVPNAPKEPDERIDKMTGQPYNIQAGSAFVDEEDPDKNLI
jgi:hypothetical protein